MNENELLLAISEMMDKKLDPIQTGLSGLKGDVTGLKTGQESLRQDVSGLKADVSTLKQDFSGLKGDVSGLKGGQELFQQEVAGLTVGQEDLKQAQIMADIKMEKGQKSLQQQVTKTNITLENDIGRKISALFDAHQLDREMIQSIQDSVEMIEETVAVNDSLSKINAQDIHKLKEKIG